MLITFLLFFALGLNEVQAICFRNESSKLKREKVGRPVAVDEYHCKIMCVEMETCLTYIFPENECFLLGKTYTDFTSCILPYYEWVKKTEDGDCPDIIAQPKIDEGYIPNPALARAIPVDSAKISFNSRYVCPYTSMTDLTLPNKTHVVQGNENNNITWDSKLGSFTFTQSIKQPDSTFVNITSYIRGAGCFSVDPSLFTDRTSCGGNILVTSFENIIDKTSAGPVQYSPTPACSSAFVGFEWDVTETAKFLDIYGPSKKYYKYYITCIDGSWFNIFVTFLGDPLSTYKVKSAVCAN